MKKNYVVGKKPTRLKLIVTIFISALLSLLCSNFLTIVLNESNVFFPIFIIIFIIIIFLYVPTIAVSCAYWSVDHEHLEYNAIHNYIDEVTYAIAVLVGKDNQYSIKLSVENIKKIDIYWTSQRYICSTIAHPVMLGIELNDGSIITFEGLYENSKDFVDAIIYMKEIQHIHINDSYQLLDILQNSNVNLNEYIEGLKNGEKGVRQDA